MTTISPDRIRRADPLAHLEPAVPPEELRRRIESIVAEAPPAPPRRRRSRVRLVAALAGATALVAAALALLPGDSSREAPASAAAILRAAAAVAADQPEPPPFAGYRYTESIWHIDQDRIVWSRMRPRGMPDNAKWPPPDVPAHEYEQRVESWVDRDWNGHRIRHAGRLISGDRSGVGFNLDKTAEDDGHLWGDTPGPKVAELPTDPRALRDNLMADFKGGNWTNVDYEITRNVVSLLAAANTTPDLRAALFGVLASTPGARPAPDAKDPLGRPGQAVVLPASSDGSGRGAITVIFDPDTSQLLSWSEGDRRQETMVRAAHVANIGDRP